MSSATAAAAAASSVAAAPSLYVLWLENVVDTSPPAVRDTLDFMSSFDSLDYKNLAMHTRYAQSWCTLSNFLYEHREQQLYSEKVNMLFTVQERKQKSSVYWFEVAQSALLLATQTMFHAVDCLGIMRATAMLAGDYAHIAVDLSTEVLVEVLAKIKVAVGVCRYALHEAAQHCKLLQVCAPQLMHELEKRYHSLRIMGCFAFSLRQLQLAQAQSVADWMDTIVHIYTSCGTVPAAVLLIANSAAAIKFYALVQQALRSGQRGLAVGFARAASSTCTDASRELVRKLEADTATVNNLSPQPVPTADSSLLRVRTTVHENALEMGDSPFDQTFTLQLKHT
jgi:hypothetical protein